MSYSYHNKNYKTFESLKGKLLTSIEKGEDEIVFSTSSGERYLMSHYQDCCESVTISEIIGEIDNILNLEILEAQEKIGHGEEESKEFNKKYRYDSVTLTDFVLKTKKGNLIIKWIGISNGYYSESVTFELLENKQE